MPQGSLGSQARLHYIRICIKKGRRARRREGDKCFFIEIFSRHKTFQPIAPTLVHSTNTEFSRACRARQIHSLFAGCCISGNFSNGFVLGGIEHVEICAYVQFWRCRLGSRGKLYNSTPRAINCLPQIAKTIKRIVSENEWSRNA